MVVALFQRDIFLKFELDLAGHVSFIRTFVDARLPGSATKALTVSWSSLRSLVICGGRMNE